MTESRSPAGGRAGGCVIGSPAGAPRVGRPSQAERHKDDQRGAEVPTRGSEPSSSCGHTFTILRLRVPALTA
ncbi:unnamed protein product [Tetraodon nigroviridis]|uniref:(spotted green pufferfish) hypothetical protein n=1 Tax=Tetraodon nigroviridis TaxID=99883 RepID=Q4RTX9_TETNG|nr:unnamed protein product [Tetraodon nigroviridis]